MKSNDSWIAVEHILERGKIRESHEIIWTTETYQTWEPDHLIRSGCPAAVREKNDKKMTKNVLKNDNK